MTSNTMVVRQWLLGASLGLAACGHRRDLSGGDQAFERLCSISETTNRIREP